MLAAFFLCLFLQPPQGKPLDKEAFFAAARAGDVAKVKAMLDGGMEVNAKNDYGATALVYFVPLEGN